MSQRIYPAWVYSSAKSGEFSLMFPDVDGCVSAGRDLNQCLLNGAAALAAHFDLMAEDGDTIPEPSDLLAQTKAARAAKGEDRDGLVGVFPITVAAPGGFMRLSISLDKELVRRIDAAAGPMKRSQFLAAAAREKLTAPSTGYGFGEESRVFTAAARKRSKAPRHGRSKTRAA